MTTVELASLAELEPALARERFDVARVFISYGACAQTGPEPCRLPLVAYTVHTVTSLRLSERLRESELMAESPCLRGCWADENNVWSARSQ